MGGGHPSIAPTLRRKPSAIRRIPVRHCRVGPATSVGRSEVPICSLTFGGSMVTARSDLMMAGLSIIETQ